MGISSTSEYIKIWAQHHSFTQQVIVTPYNSCMYKYCPFLLAHKQVTSPSPGVRIHEADQMLISVSVRTVPTA